MGPTLQSPAGSSEVIHMTSQHSPLIHLRFPWLHNVLINVFKKQQMRASL